MTDTAGNDTQQVENLQPDSGDGLADAIAAVALITIFVAVCIFWISSQ
tara:strand:- start:2504 stop:2647 length:144 start_codon:yes stop_codon:yes gene_type:complete